MRYCGCCLTPASRGPGPTAPRTALIFYVDLAFFVGQEGQRSETVRGNSPLFRSPRNRARFPALSAVFEELTELSYEDQYVLGAERIIAGLAADLVQLPTARTSEN